MENRSLVPTVIVDPARSLRDYDPFLRPEWRYERVLNLVDAHGAVRRATRRDDSYIHYMRRFLLKWRAADDEERAKLAYENPGLCTAWRIVEKARTTNPRVAFMIEARLLANQDFVEIADAIKTKPDTIQWYEALFFNVQDKLRHKDWIMEHVLLPSAERFVPEPDDLEDDDADDDIRRFVTPPVVKPHLDMTLKFFGYFGGPIMLDFMLTGFKQGVICHSQDEIRDWLTEQWGNQIVRRSTMAAGVFEINKYNVMELFATHARIIELSKGVDGADERRTIYEKHINAMLMEIPWIAGDKAKEVFEGTKIGQYDEMAAELRDEEMLLVAAGEKPPRIEEVAGLVMPAGKEVKHGNAK